ncbi:cache domain-containing protein [uncultured Desulfobacter sp.]|uniref:cache domain-containing protein n=1 Tax=uncultured Desulfobacter sp. TaxID=240139 RepID=UPI002AA5F6C0|nr:cache domain-containing protein [uncultured Desulfobacter sp.]
MTEFDTTDAAKEVKRGKLSGIRHFLSSLQIRYKFLISFALIFFLSMLLCNLFIYVYVRNNIEDRIESELTNTTAMIYDMVNTSVNVAIKNHLRAVAEKNLDILNALYQRSLAGDISPEDARKRAVDVILSQTIGTSGYLYCLDSQGDVTVHPRGRLIGINVAEHEFVRQMMTKKQGYLEYEWKNPEEKERRAKALYMAHFEPWDWIIAASAYRSEFIRLVNVEDFRQSILSLKFGQSGYAFVFDKDGRAIIHPVLQDVNIFQTPELPNQYLRDMMQRKKGRAVYFWKNPGETRPRKKLVMFNYIPEYQWVVASSSYLDELYQPLTTIRNVFLGISLLFFSIMLAVTFGLSRTITTPLRQLMARFSTATAGDYSTRMEIRSADEVGQLAGYFNRFMEQLETTHLELKDEIRVRRMAEQARNESRVRYYLLMEAAPDPIVNYDMKGRVIYINPAFARVFGWSLEECKGGKMDHFVPEACWPETKVMIHQVRVGQGIFNVETRRLTKDGRVVDVSISGASALDARGKLTGSIIILRDITRSKNLEKQVMQAGDRERMNIGQELHDDLCPHLIGISGLAAVIREDLKSRQDPAAELARKMGVLMEDAVEKTRQLARGLCPVHLVSHGFQSALEEIADQFAYYSGVQFEFSMDEGIDILDDSCAIHLYHIAREAVNNAVKHSNCDRIIIAFNEDAADGLIHLTITDNGTGIDPDSSCRGIGLQIMAYRAKIIEAQFNIDTGSKGTTILVILSASARMKIDKKENVPV